MKIFKMLLLTLLTTFLFAACTKNELGSQDKAKYGSGKEMALTFSANPSTGYDWQYEFKDGLAEIVFDREEVKQVDNSNVIGGKINRTYYFKATKLGKTKLVFTYKRPWDGGEIEYDVIYDLSVDENLVISCIDKMKGSVKSDKELDFFPNPVFTE